MSKKVIRNKIDEKLVLEICKRLGVKVSTPKNPEDAGIYINEKKMTDKDFADLFGIPKKRR